jgi:hypothetical protein
MKSFVVALLLLSLTPAPGLAWDNTRQVVHGSARILEKGETVVGVLSPLAYGVHERVTVFTHPALLLLLTPNFWARLSAWESDLALAFEAGYLQSWLAGIGAADSAETGAAGTEESAPGFLQLGGVASYAFSDRVQVSLALGYLAEFGSEVGKTSSGFYYRMGAHYLLSEASLFITEVRGDWSPDNESPYPVGSLIYARQFGRTRVGAGACFGQFFGQALLGQGESVDNLAFGESIYVYPWLDVWWRF